MSAGYMIAKLLTNSVKGRLTVQELTSSSPLIANRHENYSCVQRFVGIFAVYVHPQFSFTAKSSVTFFEIKSSWNKRV